MDADINIVSNISFSIKKENRHGKHKPGYIRPEFRTPEGRKK